MKPQIKILAGFFLGLAIVALVLGAASPGTARFEYKVVERKGGYPEQVLNAAGQEGWELVAIAEDSLGSDLTYYLKREIR